MTLATRAAIAAWADEAAMKSGLADHVEKIGRGVGGTAVVELTIASGSVTAESSSLATPFVTIDTESDAATDTLTNIVVSSHEDGEFILVGLENAARIVTITHEAGGAGQMSFSSGQDLVLAATTQWVLFWIDIAASPDTLREVARYGFDLSNEVEVNTAGTGSPNLLTEGESGKTFSNEGSSAANFHTLPLARAGLVFTFIVQDADGITVVANTSDTIRVGASVTPAAGNVLSTTVGDTIQLRAINATEWISVGGEGSAWTVSS